MPAPPAYSVLPVGATSSDCGLFVAGKGLPLTAVSAPVDALMVKASILSLPIPSSPTYKNRLVGSTATEVKEIPFWLPLATNVSAPVDSLSEYTYALDCNGPDPPAQITK